MNLKEAFRYQKFLDGLISEAFTLTRVKELSVKITEKHKYSDVDPTATDTVEVVECPKDYCSANVIELAAILTGEKYNLTNEISKAKAGAGIDIDAMIERNKYRFKMIDMAKAVLRFKNSKRKESTRGFKFNVEGNQVSYLYDVEIDEEEMYNRAAIKRLISDTSIEADRASAEIDAAMVNTVVDYTPLFDVNETFDDIMADMMSKCE